MKPATTISKVCRVLGEFRSRPSLGVTEISRRTGLLPSDVHRIVSSLKAYDFVEQNPGTKTYHLGVGFLKLGLSVYQQNQLREAARPFMLRLSERTEATAHLAIFDRRELEIFLAEQIDCSSEVPFKARYGAAASPHSTALGKAIMAGIDRETVLAVLSKSGLQPSTPQTMTRMSDVLADLDRIAAQGFSLDREESAEGACCIGAPIRGGDGAVVGALSISMAADRYYRQRETSLSSAVKTAALRISQAIGSRSIQAF